MEEHMQKLVGFALEWIWDGEGVVTDVLPIGLGHAGRRRNGIRRDWLKVRKDLGLSTDLAAQKKYENDYSKMVGLLRDGAENFKHGQAVEADDCFARAVALSGTLVRGFRDHRSGRGDEGVYTIWNLLVEAYGVPGSTAGCGSAPDRTDNGSAGACTADDIVHLARVGQTWNAYDPAS